MPTGVDWYQLANNAESELAFDLDYGAGTMQVVDGSDFPQVYPYLLTVWDQAAGSEPGADAGMEIVKVTNRSGNVLTIERGQDGTANVAHSQGDAVQLLLPAEVFVQVQEEIDQRLHVDDGASGSFTVVTAVRDNAGTLEYKSRTLTVADGQVTALGTESDWTAG